MEMNVKKQSQKQEKRITRSLKEIKEDARTTINSGAVWFDKSDIASKHFRIEAKTKIKPSKSIVVKKEWMEKIENEAFETGKLAALAISFGDGKDYFMIDEKTFYKLVEGFKGEFYKW